MSDWLEDLLKPAQQLDTWRLYVHRIPWWKRPISAFLDWLAGVEPL